MIPPGVSSSIHSSNILALGLLMNVNRKDSS